MPNNQLIAAYQAALEGYEQAQLELEPLLVRMAIETIADVLPRASLLEVIGAMNEDWLQTLRVRRVLTATGEVLVDVAESLRDPSVENAIDEVNTEYLDALIDLTGSVYMGLVTIR